MSEEDNTICFKHIGRMMVALLLLLFPLAECAPVFHSHALPPYCDTTICRVSDLSLDSALSTFLCFNEEEINAMEEKDKKRELVAAITPYLEGFLEDELVATDSDDLISLVNLVLHEGRNKVVRKTKKQHFTDLVNSVGRASNLVMKTKIYKNADTILLAMISCQSKIIAEMHQLVQPMTGDERAGRGFFGIMDIIKSKIQEFKKSKSVPGFDKPDFNLDTVSTHAWEDVSTPEYLALPASEKQRIIWDNCLEDTSEAPWFSTARMQAALLTGDMCPSLRTVGDMLPWEDGILVDGWRKKIIHSVGVVGKVEWKNLGGHDYTGVFGGSSHGIVRLSLGREPNISLTHTMPGMGLKFLRDGRDSANLLATYSLEGQESWNFFKNDFTTHLLTPTNPQLLPFAIKISKATKYVYHTGLSDWGFYGQDGEKVSNPVFPYGLLFHPTGDISFPDTYARPVNEDLVTIPSGKTLYQVWARDQPEEMGGTEAHIADLVLTSEMTTSLWGDQHLFFRHQDMWDDVDLFPEWAHYTSSLGLGVKRCPFNEE